MVRKHFNLPPEQLAWFYRESEKTGLSVSEILRKIITTHIDSLEKVSESSSERSNNG